MKFSFLPGEVKFYDYFENASQQLSESAQQLMDLLENIHNMGEHVARINEGEHQADLIVHEVTNLLPRTLITPFDPDEIMRLTSALDNAVDAIQEVAVRIQIYQVNQVRAPARQFGELIIEGARELDQAIHGMRDKGQFEQVRNHVVDVNTVEDRADAILEEALSDLVANRSDVFEFICWKEIYELLEAITDRMEDAGDVLQRVMIANA